MSDVEWFKLIFAVSFGGWLISDAVFASRFVVVLRRGGGHNPFLWSPILIAVSGTSETAIYGGALWFFPENSTALRLAYWVVPTAAVANVIAYIGLYSWAFSQRLHDA